MECSAPLVACLPNSEIKKPLVFPKDQPFRRFDDMEKAEVVSGTAEWWKQKFYIAQTLKDNDYFLLACGKCFLCRRRRQREWAVRIVHEASLYDSNLFLTLTYDDQHLPPGGNLQLRDYQLFLKRLRFYLAERDLPNIRYFACGEYGTKYSRPHYHIIVFNLKFDDMVFVKQSGDNLLYASETLSSLWPKGLAWIGRVSFASAACIAGYVGKKLTKDADVKKVPEFNQASTHPGLGYDWLVNNLHDVFSFSNCSVKYKTSSGIKTCAVPRYYYKVLERLNPFLFGIIKEKRIKFAEEDNYDYFNMCDKEFIAIKEYNSFMTEL